jgi:hypothetical protein
MVVESNNDLLKKYLKQSLNEITTLKSKFNTNREKKLKESLNKIKLLREKINTKTSDVINMILKSQEKLLLETKSIEEYLTKSLNDIRIETKVADNKNALENNKLQEVQLVSLSNEVINCKLDLANKIELLDSINNSYDFILNKTVSTETGIIGEVINKKWVNQNNFFF